MIVTKKKAIQVILSATDTDGWNAWMESHNLYNDETDEIPSVYDLFIAIGVSKEYVEQVQTGTQNQEDTGSRDGVENLSF